MYHYIVQPRVYVPCVSARVSKNIFLNYAYLYIYVYTIMGYLVQATTV